MDYYLDVWRDYFNFSGRAGRKEYWFFTLYHTIVLFIGEVLAAMVYQENTAFSIAFIAAVILYALASVIPSIAVTVRRLHDIDKSGWWYFVSFIPAVGVVWLFILTCMPGTNGPNQYGPDPKAGTQRRAEPAA